MNVATQEPRHRAIIHKRVSTDDSRSATRALVHTLHQLAGVVALLTDKQYSLKPVGVVPSSIGGHVRHCLDHIDALLAGVCCGEINYDQRTRGTDVENRRDVALVAIQRQERHLLEASDLRLDDPLRLTVMMSRDGAPIAVETTVGRELAFVLSHTIHHNALIAAMAKTLGVLVPERFGYAPATIAYLDQSSCVR